MNKNNDSLALLFFCLLCIIAEVAQADHLTFFQAYDVQAGGDQYQLKGYAVVRHASVSSSSHLAGNRYYVPVKNGHTVSRDALFKNKSVLLRNTKTTSASDQRQSAGSNGRASGSSVHSQDSAVNLDLTGRRRKRRTQLSDAQNAPPTNPSPPPPICQVSVIDFVLGDESSHVHFEWIQNQEAAATIKGRLTLTLNDGSPRTLENVSHSGIHEYIVVSELGQVSDEDRWIMENCNQELTSDDLASLGRELDESEQEQLAKFKSATAIPAMRSSYEKTFPDPVWGTNCNWEHSAFYILETRQTGWELINNAGEQHVLMMPVTVIPAEIAAELETMMGVLDEDEEEMEMGIAIQQDGEPFESDPPTDQTSHEDADAVLPLVTPPERVLQQPRPRAVSFTVRMGNSRRWEALHNPSLDNRHFYLRLIAGTISNRIDISYGRRQELKAYLDGQITPEQIQELIELGIIPVPEDRGGISGNGYHPRKDDDPDPDEGGVGGGSNGKSSTTVNHYSSGSSKQDGAEGETHSSESSGDKTSKRLHSTNQELPDSAFASWLLDRVNLTVKKPTSATKPVITLPGQNELIGVQSH